MKRTGRAGDGATAVGGAAGGGASNGGPGGGDGIAAPVSHASRVFAFRADQETASLLTAMPNASEFIRRAIARSLEEPCPVCSGRGVVAPGFGSELARLGGHILLRRCGCCGAEYPAPCDALAAGAMTASDRMRRELERTRGESLCAACLERAAACTECGRPWLEHAVAEFARHWEPARCGRAALTAPSEPAADRQRRGGARGGNGKGSGRARRLGR